MKKFIGLIFIVFTALSAQFLSIQGVLRDVSGNTVPDDNEKSFTFRIYADETGGSSVWQETTNLIVRNGVYNHTLGTVSSMGSLDFSQNYWLGISIEQGSELSPRTKLTLSPYAILASVNASNVFPQSGNVGIGVTSPAEELEVNGEISLTGDLSADGVITAGDKFEGKGTIPIGGIIMWSGATIPTGWALCNGATVNSITTPDLRNRFIVGTGDTYTIGNTGGAASVALTISQMPRHNHSYTYWGQSHATGYSHEWEATYGTHNYLDHVTGYTGGNATDTSVTDAHENRPPYYALAYIMRVQ